MKIVMAYLLVLLASSAFAGYFTEYKVAGNDLVKMERCSNGISHLAPFTQAELEQGKWVVDSKNNRFFVHMKGNEIVVENEQKREVERIALDYDPARGTVTLRDYPMNAQNLAESKDGTTTYDKFAAQKTQEKKDRIVKVTGLVRTEHRDPHGKFYAWHFIDNEPLIMKSTARNEPKMIQAPARRVVPPVRQKNDEQQPERRPLKAGAGS
ncbi:MAG: hypothetical protein HY537_03275 [Deltaproteobacteria bacterium]|nr:hypothetical protein [Deltaproteobacteria bacterium]